MTLQPTLGRVRGWGARARAARGLIGAVGREPIKPAAGAPSRRGTVEIARLDRP
ncbi:MAG: hypothetical protein M3460_06510 [Actinomycetota bacterium]|nr:hypothetical protein [Actinomycetota bacterium]